MMKQTKPKATKRPGRPKVDPNAPPPPTLSVEAAAKRYKVGRDQMAEAARRGQVPTVLINDRQRIVTSKADELFGLSSPAV